MHLIKNALHDEIMTRIETDDVEPADRMWYAGYMMGLLQAGLLTQDEHDWLLTESEGMFEFYFKDTSEPLDRSLTI